ncbi:hypothetical protein ABIF38_005282 [Bradyrhizobium japonicum]|uniref:pilus assembly protein N-terminal domain-containing protein n=1 Tax=Bradyrhizobium elkanii TaxID=29448 RepID=UPI0003646F8A|nr:pilus assembly protein N-terminal domain-containing protein [Bradyrhizobium elkanii]MCP1732406.1 hypothetical protein [Bradyrhizobium elkanii]MCS3567744.1 hypothetical protein [Bradyrhizobium elkanii]MCS3590773.1 hypothetical protein [Bradyrhizobium elkanii]MCS3620216.1 hypothetical protein [Bradyrhizobium elkanii]GEC56764.1 hypothetical protein BEL01nite_58070 [Bradyrhizobium elkanii]
MKIVGSAPILAICVLLSVPVMAEEPLTQQKSNGPPPRERTGPTTSGDVITQAAVPAPENGNIIVKFGETTKIYFKRPIKSVRLDDDLLVKVMPLSDHTVAFTGLSPGRASVTVESKDGKTDSWGLVSVVREPHVVKIYQQGEINKQTGERRSDSSSAIGGYVTLSCNEIGCTELEPELQPKWPTGRP